MSNETHCDQIMITMSYFSYQKGDDLMLKVAVIGLGDISKIHIQLFRIIQMLNL